MCLSALCLLQLFSSGEGILKQISARMGILGKKPQGCGFMNIFLLTLNSQKTIQNWSGDSMQNIVLTGGDLIKISFIPRKSLTVGGGIGENRTMNTQCH